MKLIKKICHRCTPIKSYNSRIKSESLKLKIGNKCNNNCITCRSMNVKENYDKNLEEIKKELNYLKEKNYKEIIFPCNLDIRKDFFDILKYAKHLGLKITLETNARMFYYKTFCNKISDLIDNYKIIFYTINNDIHDTITNTKNTLYQTIKGIDHIISTNKNTTVTIPLIKTNSETIIETINFLKNIKNIEIRINNPRPRIYRKLDKIKNKKKIKIIDLPKEIKFEITARCNLKCDFCFNRNSFSRDLEDLPRNKIFSLIDKIADSGVRIIRFTGGEPFLRKDIMKFIKHAKCKGLYVRLNTNLTSINKDHINKLKKYVDYMHISFNLTNYENITKDKHLKNKIILIKYLLRNNIKLGLNTVATKHSIQQLKKINKIIQYLNCGWTLLRQVPTKNNKCPVDNYDIKILVENLIEINKEFNKSYRIQALPFCSYDPEKVKQVSELCGLFYSLSIDPSGKIKSCYSINENLGNILKLDITDAWGKKFSANIRKLKLLPDICKKCRYLYGCFGGCRFAAKFINGSYDSMDPLAMPKKFLQ